MEGSVSFWVLVQVFVNLVLFAGVALVWVRLNRPAKDDPRLSRGLQLLQSKISVLEDLADRTETQSLQLTALMEQKCKEIQNYVVEADRQIQRIQASMGKSLEVAKIFQDKIPHQEIIERQNTIKYVKAARMANEGKSVEEISSVVDLARGEIEFIAKVNRDQLQFSIEDLPAWAQEELAASASQDTVMGMRHDIIEQPAIATQVSIRKDSTQTDALSQLGNQFRNAFQAAPVTTIQASPEEIPEPIKPVAAKRGRPTKAQQDAAREADRDVVKKVIFPKIDINNNLG